MIIGVGTDLIEIDRIVQVLDKFPHRFVTRIFTVSEQQYALQTHFPAAAYAKRFAAKEACLKALGIGLSQGILWTDVEVYNDFNGQPHIRLHNKAQKFIEQRYDDRMLSIHLSLTDTKYYAQAFVIISSQEI